MRLRRENNTGASPVGQEDIIRIRRIPIPKLDMSPLQNLYLKKSKSKNKVATIAWKIRF